MSKFTRLDQPCPQCGGVLIQSSRRGFDDGPAVLGFTSCCGKVHACTECGHSHSQGCGYRIDHEKERLEDYKRQVSAHRYSRAIEAGIQ